MRSTDLFRFRSLPGLLLCGLCQILHAQPGGEVHAFTGGRMIIGTNDAVIEQGVLVIEDGRIIAAGEQSSVSVPSGAVVHDVSGKTLMPGMINAHGHVADDTRRKLEVYAAYGVTTVLSLGGEDASHVRLRDSQAANGADEAWLMVAGPIPNPELTAEAEAAIAGLAAMDVDWVKIRVQNGSLTETLYAALIREAHERNLQVAAHMYTLEDARGLLEHDVDMLAHSIRDREVDQAFIDLMKASGACLSPTLMRDVSTYAYAEPPDFFADPFFLAEALPAEIEAMQGAQASQQSARALEQGEADLAMGQRNLGLLYEAGVPVAMGTDSGAFTGRFPGYFEHMELELMAEAGMSNEDVIRSATGTAARCLGIDGETGSLEAGKRADFIILDENPLDDIRNTRTIETVMLGGRQVR